MYDYAEVKVTDPGNYSQDWWRDNWGIPTIQTRAQLMAGQVLPALAKKKRPPSGEGVPKKSGLGAVAKKARLEPRRSRKRRLADEAANGVDSPPGDMIKILKVEGGTEDIVIKQEVVDDDDGGDGGGGVVLPDDLNDPNRLEMSPFEGTKSFMCAFCPKRYYCTLRYHGARN